MTQLNEAVVRQLTSQGWRPLRGGAAIAGKAFDTAVGPKEVHVYVADYGAACEQVAVQGQYYSEGRNILEASSVLVPRTASAELVSQLVSQFAERCEAAISDSYAVRLLR